MGVLLARLVRQERESVRLMEALAPKPQFEDVLEHYGASGFLYPAKLEALRAQMPSIEQTWRRALSADTDIFRLVWRFGMIDDAVRLRNTISAFAYTPSTWHAQHLVSRDRHEYARTLVVLIELIDRFHKEGVSHIRLSFRPNNPGTKSLFGETALRMPADVCKLAICDYGCVPVAAVRLPTSQTSTVTVRPVVEGAVAERFYEQVLHPVEVASLTLGDPELRQMDAAYRPAGLRRARNVLVAVDHGEVVGSCVVNASSVGLNFSFLENAVEHLRVRPDLSAPRRAIVWNALAAGAVQDVQTRGTNVVVALDPGDRDLSARANLITAEPKQYAVVTVARRDEGYLRAVDYFVDYYRKLLIAEATR